MRESSAILWAGGHITDTLAPVLQEIDNVMNAKCVYTWKADEQGLIVKAKSRLMAGGFKQ